MMAETHLLPFLHLEYPKRDSPMTCVWPRDTIVCPMNRLRRLDLILSDGQLRTGPSTNCLPYTLRIKSIASLPIPPRESQAMVLFYCDYCVGQKFQVPFFVFEKKIEKRENRP
jgi:hypothetical protein